jgi:hypothetical protein
VVAQRNTVSILS